MSSSLPSRWAITTANFANDPDIFPLLPGFSFITSKSPTWSTGVAAANSGRERRTMNWSFPKWNFKVAYEVLRDAPSLAEVQTLEGFFNAHAGQYQSFFFFDPSDNKVTNQFFGTGDGVTTTFQLIRTLGFGSIEALEPIRGVVGSPTIMANGSAVGNWTIGPLGQITFSSAPPSGATLTWTGQFMFLCRFAQDNLDVAQMMNGLWSASGISLVSEKR